MIGDETCTKCHKPMAGVNRRFQCSGCKAWFCPSCMDRFCLFCRGAVKEIASK